MTKNYFIQLADYNIWANNMFHGWFDKISEQQWEQSVVSSFNSIAETALHTVGAETIWLDRVNKLEHTVWLPSVFKGSKQDVQDAWKKSSRGLRSFIENFDETKMQDSLSFMRPDNKSYELAHYQIFAHVLNHSAYHRGQLVTMLRQVGFTDISSTDLSTYFWSQKVPNSSAVAET
jgi:uncharacterized damage-inducible protein DinB